MSRTGARFPPARSPVWDTTNRRPSRSWPHRYPPLLGLAAVVGVENRPHERVPEDRGGEIEADPMLPEIARRLGRVPLELKHAAPLDVSAGRRVDIGSR